MYPYELTAEQIKTQMLNDYEMFGYCPDDSGDCACGNYRSYIKNFFQRQFGHFPLKPEHEPRR